MKQIRTYKVHDHEYYQTQLATYMPDAEELAYLKGLLDGTIDGYESFDAAVQRMIGLYSRHARFDGDRYDIYYCYLTKHDRIGVVNEWGYSI